jgi:LmbE family N-acetylglucosaminyl deacetylase
MPDTLLLLVAHADDTEFLAGGTVALYADRGWDVIEVITTNNERGSFELDRETLIEQSRREALEAARILGKREVVFLGYPDGMLSDVPLNELREVFIRRIRRHRPRIVMTFDPFAPYETHPDHRAVAMAAAEAAGFAALPLFHPEHAADGLRSHYVAEKHFFAKHPSGPQTAVDIERTLDRKIRALCAHDSQMKLTIDEIALGLSADDPEHPLLATLDRERYEPAVERLVRAAAAAVGKRHGLAYAETFRIEKAGVLGALAAREGR